MGDFKTDFVEAFKHLWRELLAEFIGTLFLVLIGCGSTVGGDFNTNVSFLEIALCFGVAVGVIVHVIAHISGGHINPAVTIGMLIIGKIPIYKAIFFIIAQVLGGIAGAFLLLVSLPKELYSSLGLTKVTILNYGQAILIEFLITFLLVFAVFMVFDNRKHASRHEPLIIGFVVATCHIHAIKFTGASMNPARSFGPALMAFDFEDHWVYWVGPILGGIVAAVIYKFIFEPPEEVKAVPDVPKDVEQGTVAEPSEPTEPPVDTAPADEYAITEDNENENVPENPEKEEQ